MKKTVTCMIFALSGIISVSAQYYIGGSVSFTGTFQKQKNLEQPSPFSYCFIVSPDFGYTINNKLDAGLRLDVVFISPAVTYTTVDISNITMSGVKNSLSIAPYLRYSVFQFGKFNLSGQANLFATFLTGEYNHGPDYPVEKFDGQSYGLYLYPVLMYNLSGKITLKSDLNFLRIGCEYMDVSTLQAFSFTTNLNTNKALVSIGVVYKF